MGSPESAYGVFGKLRTPGGGTNETDDHQRHHGPAAAHDRPIGQLDLPAPPQTRTTDALRLRDEERHHQPVPGVERLRHWPSRAPGPWPWPASRSTSRPPAPPPAASSGVPVSWNGASRDRLELDLEPDDDAGRRRDTWTTVLRRRPDDDLGPVPGPSRSSPTPTSASGSSTLGSGCSSGHGDLRRRALGQGHLEPVHDGLGPRRARHRAQRRVRSPRAASGGRCSARARPTSTATPSFPTTTPVVGAPTPTTPPPSTTTTRIYLPPGSAGGQPPDLRPRVLRHGRRRPVRNRRPLVLLEHERRVRVLPALRHAGDAVRHLGRHPGRGLRAPSSGGSRAWTAACTDAGNLPERQLHELPPGGRHRPGRRPLLARPLVGHGRATSPGAPRAGRTACEPPRPIPTTPPTSAPRTRRTASPCGHTRAAARRGSTAWAPWRRTHRYPAAASSTFYLAQIEAVHAGKTVVISLWDPGDTGSLSANVQILIPDASGYTPATVKWSSAKGTTNSGASSCNGKSGHRDHDHGEYREAAEVQRVLGHHPGRDPGELHRTHAARRDGARLVEDPVRDRRDVVRHELRRHDLAGPDPGQPGPSRPPLRERP